MLALPRSSRNLLLLALFVAATAACSGSSPPSATLSLHGDAPAPPVAARHEHLQTVNGVTWDDPYYWLRDREDPEVIAYLEAENAYTEAVMAPTEPVQTTLYEEMLGRVQESDLSVPYRDGEYWYYARTVEGQAYPMLCRKHGDLEAPEEVLLDENELAAGHDYFSLGVQEVSPDHQLLAYGVDVTGSELHDLHFRDLTTGADVGAVLTGVFYGLAWANDSQTVYYTTVDETYRPHQVWRYQLRGPVDSAELLYTEADERFYVDVARSRSDAFVVMTLESSVTTEQWVFDADDPRAEARIIAPREQGVEYRIEHHGASFFIVTNAGDRPGGAVNFRLVEAPLETPGREHWTEVIAPRDDVMLVGVDAFEDWMAIWEREDGLPQVRIRDLDSGETHRLEMPEPTYDIYAGTNIEFETDRLRFRYASLVTPRQVWDYDVETRERELLKEQPVLGGYNPDDYVSERLFATADDGTAVPISLVRRRDVVGPAPLVLTGYGAYGLPYDVYFSSNRLSLLDRGVVVAIAHVRGGGEMGRPWYEDGKLLNKRNTFTDFIACGEHLIAEGYTTAGQLAITGGSAGGLLMGAVTNLRPDLFAAVVAEVPFVDALTTMLDETIPLTVTEWEEWGNPNESAYFETMRSYSPYDNVAPADYPDMLVTAGLNDPRVGFWEAAKWVARLRATVTGEPLILLRTNMGAGHFGATGRYGRLQRIAFTYAFILDRLGVE